MVRMSTALLQMKERKKKKDERTNEVHHDLAHYVVEAAGPTNALPLAAARGAHRTFLLPSEYWSDTVPAPRIVTIVCLRQTCRMYPPSIRVRTARFSKAVRGRKIASMSGY